MDDGISLAHLKDILLLNALGEWISKIDVSKMEKFLGKEEALWDQSFVWTRDGSGIIDKAKLPPEEQEQTYLTIHVSALRRGSYEIRHVESLIRASKQKHAELSSSWRQIMGLQLGTGNEGKKRKRDAIEDTDNYDTTSTGSKKKRTRPPKEPVKDTAKPPRKKPPKGPSKGTGIATSGKAAARSSNRNNNN